jgi:HAD superfamily hydrolase (TIGR01490 family)
MEAAFFDLDKTVIAKASIAAFAPHLRRAGFISTRTALHAARGQLVFRLFGADERRMRATRETALRLAAGWERARLRSLVQDHLIDVMEPIVYDEALALIDEHRGAGRRVYLVSASPSEIVRPLAGYLGVHDAICTTAEVDGEGRYTGRVAFYAYGPHKAAAMEREAERFGIDLSPTCPCWNGSATPWRSTPTVSCAALRASVGGRRAPSPAACRFATGWHCPRAVRPRRSGSASWLRARQATCGTGAHEGAGRIRRYGPSWPPDRAATRARPG